MDSQLIKISESIISNQVSLSFNEQIKHTPFYKGDLKRKLNPVLFELKQAEKREYSLIETEDCEDSTDELFNAKYDAIKEFASLNILDYENIKYIIKAYKKNPKSINGIVNKILK